MKNLSLKALLTTVTELMAMAVPAIIGFRVGPPKMCSTPSGHRDADDVEGERPEQILLDVAHGRPGQVERGQDGVQVRVHQDHVAGFHGHVDARAHGDADVRLGQGRGVVDAVADHGHLAALGLQAVHLLGLAVGQDPGHDLVDARAPGDDPRVGLDCRR